MNEGRALQRRQLRARSGAAPARASRWQRWAEALLARYGRATSAPPVGATLRRSSIATPIVLLWQRADIAIALHQALQLDQRWASSARHESWHLHQHAATLVRWLVRSTLAAAPAFAERAQPKPAALPPRGVSAVERVQRTLFGRRFVSRQVRPTEAIRAPFVHGRPPSERRRVRVAVVLEEIVTRLRRRAERQLPDGAALPPVRPVVARPAPVRAPDASLERAFPPNAPAPFARGPAQAQPPAVPPPLNLDRITEQVIDRLDRRITAQRERMGRI